MINNVYIATEQSTQNVYTLVAHYIYVVNRDLRGDQMPKDKILNIRIEPEVKRLAKKMMHRFGKDA